MFLNHLYGGMDEPELKIIDVFICKLRKKLANASQGKNYIETVWGRGYVLREGAPEMRTMASYRLVIIRATASCNLGAQDTLPREYVSLRLQSRWQRGDPDARGAPPRCSCRTAKFKAMRAASICWKVGAASASVRRL